MSEVSQPLQHLEAQIEARVQAIRADRDWWPCRRGCDACCRHLAHPPELSAAEWTRVDAAVASLPTPIQAVVEQKIEALLRQSVEQTLSVAVVCPYLDEQAGACRIYDARPIACRTYGFFVARDHDQYCGQIETEVNDRGDAAIVWGHAESMRHDVERLSGQPIAFATHYRDRIKR
ncbi:MAG TPA: YkgJ family cysteine cluster protein [Candidatus Sericytochromatia bacterium]